MKKLYPIIRRAKTNLGYKTDNGMWLAYCPICNKRLSMKKVHPKHSILAWKYEQFQKTNGNKLFGKPTYCEKCGSLIYPLS